jgi:hypothetical protein
MVRLSQETVKYSRVDLQALIDEYEGKIKALEG